MAAQLITGCDQMGLVRSDCDAHKGKERCQRKIFSSYYCYITKDFKTFWLRTMTYGFPHDSVVTRFDQGSAGDFLLVSLGFCFVLFSLGVFHVSAFTWEHGYTWSF